MDKEAFEVASPSRKLNYLLRDGVNIFRDHRYLTYTFHPRASIDVCHECVPEPVNSEYVTVRPKPLLQCTEVVVDNYCNAWIYSEKSKHIPYNPLSMDTSFSIIYSHAKYRRNLGAL